MKPCTFPKSLFASAALVSLIWVAGCSSSDPYEPPIPSAAPRDTIPPEDVTDLRITMVTPSRAMVNWTIPQDEGSDEYGLCLYIRYSEVEITEENWNDQPARQICDSREGTPDSLLLWYLNPETTYWVAIKAHDWSGNYSEISENCTFTTLPAEHLQFSGQAGVSFWKLVDFSPSHVVVMDNYVATPVNVSDPEHPYVDSYAAGLFPYHVYGGNVCSKGDYFFYLTDCKWDQSRITEAPGDFVVDYSPVGFNWRSSTVVWGNFPDCMVYWPKDAIGVVGDHVFFGADSLGVAEISNPSAAQFLGFSSQLQVPAAKLHELDGHLLTWNVETGSPLSVLDVSSPLVPTMISSYDPGTGYLDVDILDNLILILTEGGDLQVVDATNPAQLLLRSTVSLGEGINALAAADGMVYATRLEGGLFYYSLADPDAPAILGYCDVPIHPDGVWARDDILFVRDGTLLLLRRSSLH